MRPSTPKKLNLAQQSQRQQPSSPPQTPTTPPFKINSNRRNGMLFKPATLSSTITPLGNGPGFSYTPFNKLNPADFSPRSSSPESSRPSSPTSSQSDAPPRSFSSSPAAETHSPTSSPRRTRARIIAATLATFTVEEFKESDYDGYSSSDSVIRPHQYEDADSVIAASLKSSSSAKKNKKKLDAIDARLMAKMKELDCEDEDREAWVEQMRAEKRRKRRSSSSVQKRTISMSIGSDTDEEDLQAPVLEDANEAGSSARRLRRKVGERASLIFDDPPERIDEEDEPEDGLVVEEHVGIPILETEGDGLPYWEFVLEMDVDDSDED